MKNFFPFLALALVMLALTGCERDHSPDAPITILGYTAGSPQREDSIKKLHIPRVSYVPDKVKEPHLQMEVTNLIISEFTKEQTYEVVPTAEEADGELRVQLVDMDFRPTQFIDKKDDSKAAGVATAFRTIIYANITMYEYRDGEPVAIWSRNRVRGKHELLTTDDISVTRHQSILIACADLAQHICEQAVERW
ncbi:hypothetical protein IKW72_02810 [bacterium]|nr:hypothetical protein [bacterium]